MERFDNIRKGTSTRGVASQHNRGSANFGGALRGGVASEYDGRTANSRGGTSEHDRKLINSGGEYLTNQMWLKNRIIIMS